MGLLGRFLTWFLQVDATGARLEGSSCWIVSVSHIDVCFFRALPQLFDEDTFLCFEGTTERHFSKFLSAYAVPEPLKISPGTLWPKSDWYHIPLHEKIMTEAANIVEQYSVAIPSIHAYVHNGRQVLLEWHDAFGDDPILISETLSESAVAAFAEAIGAQGIEKSALTTAECSLK